MSTLTVRASDNGEVIYPVSPCSASSWHQHAGAPRSSIPGLLKAPSIHTSFHHSLCHAVPSIWNALPHLGCLENPILASSVQCPLLQEAFPDCSVVAPELTLLSSCILISHLSGWLQSPLLHCNRFVCMSVQRPNSNFQVFWGVDLFLQKKIYVYLNIKQM